MLVVVGVALSLAVGWHTVLLVHLPVAPRLTLRTSLDCARMKLWDEDRRRMVGFPR